MKRASTTTLEKALYFVASLIVLGVVGAALFLELSGPDDARPRLVAVQHPAPWEDAGAMAIPWTVHNESSLDVERVQVEVSVGDEEVTQEVDYLPGGTSRSGVARLPGGVGEPRVEVKGYRLP